MPDSEEEQIQEVKPREPNYVNVQIEVQQPDSYIYSNVASVSISPWDIRIGFADFSIGSSEETTQVKPTVGVVLPPEHAAGLVFILMDQLKRFEMQFGPIRNKKWRHMVSEVTSRTSAPEEDPPTS